MTEKIIIYQVLPRLFGNTNSNPVINGGIEENGSGKLNDFTEKALTEIRKLGCNHIWYTGIIEHATQTDYSEFGIKKDNPQIVKGKAGSPYAIKDYYSVDPDLAIDVPNRMNEFEALVERSHRADLKVIIDFVPNHVAREYHSVSKPELDFGLNDDTSVHFSPQNNFYYIPRQKLDIRFNADQSTASYHEYPAKSTGNDCFGAFPSEHDWYETVKLNYGVDYQNGNIKHFEPVPDTWLKMKLILSFWASKNIDGFRCDMAEMVPVEFWGWVIPQIKKDFLDIIFIAEVYNPHEYRKYIKRGHFDYLYDKVGLYDQLRKVSQGHAPAFEITRCWQSLDDLQPHMLNFLENHDEQRIASEQFLGNAEKIIPALVVSATMNTNPFMIYSGQEFGEKGEHQEGFSGYDGRTSLFDYWSLSSIRRWNNGGKYNLTKLKEEEKKLFRLYRLILNSCNSEDAIREGHFFDLMYVNTKTPHLNPYKHYIYLRKYKNDFILIITNFDDIAADLEINIPQHAFDFLEIKNGNYRFNELLTNEVKTTFFDSNKAFITRIEKFSAQLWKASMKNNVVKKDLKIKNLPTE